MLDRIGLPQQLGLLEQIALRTGCLFVCELEHLDRQKLLWAVETIPPSSYALWEWNDAVHYLTGKNLYFSRQEDAVFYLRSIFAKS